MRMQHRAGLFCLAKDLTRDRLILDSRPANQLEEGITTWTSSMASITPLLDLFIPPGHAARCAGEDLVTTTISFRSADREPAGTPFGVS